MKYLFAVFLPPIAVLLCGKPFQAFINIFLCLLAWIPGMIHAICVVASHESQRRHEQLIAAVTSSKNKP